MSASMSNVTEALLYAEHLLLGGIFDDEEALLALPAQYGALEKLSEREAFRHGCALSDLQGMGALLVSGEGAPALVSSACANEQLAVGECRFGAIITGDGSLASVPLVARTGDTEYLLWDPTERGMMLEPWLGFLANIEQDGFRPFKGAVVEDVSDALVPLLLWGPEAPTVLADYVASTSVLPAPGQVRSINLDRIACLVANIAHMGSTCYLLMVPPAATRVLWRSLLSFMQVVPVGHHALQAEAESQLPWMSQVLGGDRLEVPAKRLVAWGIARAQGGYVGARALGV